jgi:hypothetical protein
MNVVMCYTEGDGCTYSCDHDLPFEYESAEAALVEFERLFNEARDAGNPKGNLSMGRFVFIGTEFYCCTFVHERKVYLPEFYTLDEWFAVKRIDR